ncbi:unnamed protein product [Schistosoma mattheei]|uniref:Uncharacterized protein n=1 Tax=Schistosoma mattheei TaxID=31246 RepID=A0A183PV48_9TREM|nr:unnamed protein product [Schistosoma mattheei]
MNFLKPIFLPAMKTERRKQTLKLLTTEPLKLDRPFE